MPINITVHQEAGYFLARYTGVITEEEVLREHDRFFSSGEWNARLNALVDFHGADLGEASSIVLRRVAGYFEKILKANQANGVKTAIFAPGDFPYGIGRIYEALTMKSPQTVQVFRDISEARRWLEGELILPED
jgi:hypothetical protein